MAATTLTSGSRILNASSSAVQFRHLDTRPSSSSAASRRPELPDSVEARATARRAVEAITDRLRQPKRARHGARSYRDVFDTMVSRLLDSCDEFRMRPAKRLRVLQRIAYQFGIGLDGGVMDVDGFRSVNPICATIERALNIHLVGAWE